MTRRPSLASIEAWAEDLSRLDARIYEAVGETSTPALDDAMRRISNAANWSRLSVTTAALLALLGGSRGRQAACSGLVSVAVTSGVVNLLLKPAGRRERPEVVPRPDSSARQVRMPASASFPSGHTASAFAFSAAVGQLMPVAGIPLRTLATVVGYSRVHTGVHYPGDVIAGALIGDLIGSICTNATAGRVSRRPSP